MTTQTSFPSQQGTAVISYDSVAAIHMGTLYNKETGFKFAFALDIQALFTTSLPESIPLPSPIVKVKVDRAWGSGVLVSETGLILTN